MAWAPWREASWARCSCFWIIDSLSPVQLAWTSAPRTVRGISRVTSTDVPKRGESTPRRTAGRRWRALATVLLAHAPWGALVPVLGTAFAGTVRRAILDRACTVLG